MSETDWSNFAVSQLPTGTVTLLLADVEGSSQLWETQPEEMTAAVARLDLTLVDLVAAHDGVRPVEQGEGDSFVVAFSRASDAVACALDLQRAPLGPIFLRMGIHTGEIQLRDEGNYIGPTINRTARLRDLAHGGQTVLSGATESMVLDHLPADAWLNDLGSHPLRDLPRRERVVQLCHPDLRNEFPPLRSADAVEKRVLPAQLTRFIGRDKQIGDIREALVDNRLVTLTGAGGVGKTRLAVQVAGYTTEGAVWYVDLAPVTDPDMLPVAVIRAMGLPDQPGRSTVETILDSIGGRLGLMVLDNCEHLLDSSAELIVTLLERCPGLTLLATSREPIGVRGELTWRVPSLSIADEAIELFTDRARHVRSDFAITDDNIVAVGEICKRLDGMPLAIELAAARVRALSVPEILDGIHDRFRLLTRGSRKAVRRQQTLRASVDWSHAMLTQPEAVLFRRLAAFMVGFDLEAAQFVADGGEVASFQVLDLITLLVDKSLVSADSTSGRMRYRLLETVRQYALEKLSESGEADAVRDRHRDHYTAMAVRLETPAIADRDLVLERAEIEIDNLRAAFTWSQERGDVESALRLACSLQPLWLMRGRVQEGLAWFDQGLMEHMAGSGQLSPVIHATALADQALLESWAATTGGLSNAEQALAIARQVGDALLLLRVLTSCIGAAAFDAEAARPHMEEALELARALGDDWRLGQILGWKAYIAILVGDPISARAAGEEGYALADAVGDRFISRFCRYWGPAMASFQQGDIGAAVAAMRSILAEADASGDVIRGYLARIGLGHLLVLRGDISGGRADAEEAVAATPRLGPSLEPWAYAPLAVAALAEGDLEAAADACELAWQRISAQPETAIANALPLAELELARGDLTAARKWADANAAVMMGWHLAKALVTRARVASEQGELESAQNDLHQALACAADHRAYQIAPDAFETLAEVADKSGDHREAARFLGAAEAMRQRTGLVRFVLYDTGYAALVARARDMLGEAEFRAAWDEGGALSTEEAIAYAQRGRGERKRPSSGWGALTPTELGVARLVSEGLANKEIATRLFISPRTVQTHLTHVYTKLGLTSRVQLAQETARHG
ncbi:transcriptional regulator [Mycolicibacterium celeriflavum]|uniref:helix-turn-helix transcriptional regulator n=1 Tax=Mycolicibacterium celeriflavum TaxID=1249101 RepID=UPI0007FE6E66|nr:LuxR family transcriptional regulator [Mycolicibacterium celeriflavum]OBG22828.1 transcriptional regulator [Mycolicibacterium celeriflavum]